MAAIPDPTLSSSFSQIPNSSQPFRSDAASILNKKRIALDHLLYQLHQLTAPLQISCDYLPKIIPFFEHFVQNIYLEDAPYPLTERDWHVLTLLLLNIFAHRNLFLHHSISLIPPYLETIQFPYSTFVKYMDLLSP